jgi:hypothetical protein
VMAGEAELPWGQRPNCNTRHNLQRIWLHYR